MGTKQHTHSKVHCTLSRFIQPQRRVFTPNIGSSVELHGLTNATSGLFNVTLTSDSDQSIIEQQQITGLSSFLTYTTLFYATGLDQTSNHTLTITNIENKTLAVDGMNVTVISGGHVYVSLSQLLRLVPFRLLLKPILLPFLSLSLIRAVALSRAPLPYIWPPAPETLYPSSVGPT